MSPIKNVSAKEFFAAELVQQVSIETADGHFAVDGILDDEYAAAGVGELGVESSTPAFMAPTSVLPNVAEGDTLTATVDGEAVEFSVLDIEPDGQGFTTLKLHKD